MFGDVLGVDVGSLAAGRADGGVQRQGHDCAGAGRDRRDERTDQGVERDTSTRGPEQRGLRKHGEGHTRRAREYAQRDRDTAARAAEWLECGSQSEAGADDAGAAGSDWRRIQGVLRRQLVHGVSEHLGLFDCFRRAVRQVARGIGNASDAVIDHGRIVDDAHRGIGSEGDSDIHGCLDGRIDQHCAERDSHRDDACHGRSEYHDRFGWQSRRFVSRE